MTAIVREAQVLYDARGRKTHVVLPIQKYKDLLERLQGVEDIKAIKEVEHEKRIPWTDVKMERNNIRSKTKRDR